jgi:hypothetical protein
MFSQCFRDDEILDSFDGDSFGTNNVDTPTIQRRAFRNRSFRQPISTSTQELSTDDDLDIGGQGRKSHKFRTLTGKNKSFQFGLRII